MSMLAFLLVILVQAQDYDHDNNCSTIIVGKDASASGFVMVGHNEDDGGNQIVNIYKSFQKDNKRGEVIRFKDGASESQASHSYAYLWIEMPGQDFADSYLNENGVLITSNSCPSKEQYGEIIDGGIGFDLRRVVAERALSARTGVELAGAMVEKWGYNASGRTYTIADKYEAWVFAVVKGKQWVARRVPDDNVAFIPNYYTIKEIDLDDTENYLASKDLIDYARRRRWYDPDTDGKFNFSKVYSSERSLESMANIGRMWVGVSLLSGSGYQLDDDFPFSIVPGKKLELSDVFSVLSNHYEGTDLDDSKGYENGSPHNNKTMGICASSQQVSFVAELRFGLPFSVGGRLWIAPRRGCVNVYMPVYFGVTEIPASLAMDDPETAFEQHFTRPASIYEKNDNLAWWNFVAVTEYVENDFSERYPQRQKIKNDLLKDFLKMTDRLEKEYVPIYKKEPVKAEALINDFENEVLRMILAENRKFLEK